MSSELSAALDALSLASFDRFSIAAAATAGALVLSVLGACRALRGGLPSVLGGLPFTLGGF